VLPDRCLANVKQLVIRYKVNHLFRHSVNAVSFTSGTTQYCAYKCDPFVFICKQEDNPNTGCGLRTTSTERKCRRSLFEVRFSPDGCCLHINFVTEMHTLLFHWCTAVVFSVDSLFQNKAHQTVNKMKLNHFIGRQMPLQTMHWHHKHLM